MEKDVEFLPLGSIVLLKGGTSKLIIVARGLQVKYDGEDKFFDYGAAIYPKGIDGDRLAYFNADAIAKVIFHGYADDDDKTIVENINRFISSNHIDRISRKEIERKRKEDGVHC